MQKVEDYRRHAEECRDLADRSRSPEEREMLLNMAHTWENLATNRLSQFAQQRRVKNIAAGPAGDDQMNGASIPVDRLNASNDE
jgi:hypothetical protein